MNNQWAECCRQSNCRKYFPFLLIRNYFQLILIRKLSEPIIIEFNKTKLNGWLILLFVINGTLLHSQPNGDFAIFCNDSIAPRQSYGVSFVWFPFSAHKIRVQLGQMFCKKKRFSTHPAFGSFHSETAVLILRLICRCAIKRLLKWLFIISCHFTTCSLFLKLW